VGLKKDPNGKVEVNLGQSLEIDEEGEIEVPESEGGGSYIGDVSEKIGSFDSADPDILFTLIEANGGSAVPLGVSTRGNGFRKVVRGLVGGSDPFDLTGDFMNGVTASGTVSFDGQADPQWVELFWNEDDSTWYIGSFSNVTFSA
jgi:hypothetical protein